MSENRENENNQNEVAPAKKDSLLFETLKNFSTDADSKHRYKNIGKGDFIIGKGKIKRFADEIAKESERLKLQGMDFEADATKGIAETLKNSNYNLLTLTGLSAIIGDRALKDPNMQTHFLKEAENINEKLTDRFDKESGFIKNNYDEALVQMKKDPVLNDKVQKALSGDYDKEYFDNDNNARTAFVHNRLYNMGLDDFKDKHEDEFVKGLADFRDGKIQSIKSSLVRAAKNSNALGIFSIEEKQQLGK